LPLSLPDRCDFWFGPGVLGFSDSFSKGVFAMLRKSLFISTLLRSSLAHRTSSSAAISQEFDKISRSIRRLV